MAIMEFNDESTWPTDVLTYLDQHRILFVGWSARGLKSGVSPDDYDAALTGLRAILNNHRLHGYHCTRLTASEIKQIEARGMGLPNGAMLRQRIRALEAERQITSSVARRLMEENSADHPSRAARIWFCFFPPHMGGESGINSLLRYWGGEALYRHHDRDPERGPILERLGIPCLIEAYVPIAGLRDPSFLDVKAVSQFLHTRGLPTTEPLDHEDYSQQPIAAANITRIIQFPHADFVKLTRCNTWRSPLR